MEDTSSDSVNLEYTRKCHPTHFEPSLKFIDIPENCPEEITKAVKDSFRSFWENGSAQDIRTALERIMDVLNVRKDAKLHNRIEILCKQPAFKQYETPLFALKWLGNTASHNSNCDRSDIIDAYTILEALLEEIFGNRSELLNNMAKGLLDKHKKT